MYEEHNKKTVKIELKETMNNLCKYYQHFVRTYEVFLV